MTFYKMFFIKFVLSFFLAHSILGFELKYQIMRLINPLLDTECSNYIADLPDYECVKQHWLGYGAFSVTFQVKPKTEEINYVVKVQHFTENSNFNKEEEIMKTLTGGPYIVTFIDSKIANGFLYEIMEFIPNGSLDKFRLKSEKTFSDPRFYLTFLKQIAEGTAYIHGHNLVWADMKLDNIMVAGDNTPRLIDFNISENANQLVGPRGTLLYMDPNFFGRVLININPMNDVYSFGVVAYLLWFKKHPFGPVDDLMTNIQKGKFTLWSGIPKLAAQIIDGCLKQDEKQRYTFEDMVKLLEQALAEPNIELLSESYVGSLNSKIDFSTPAGFFESHYHGIRKTAYYVGAILVSAVIYFGVTTSIKSKKPDHDIPMFSN